MTAGGKTLNHAQIQFYKQQQLLRQQQQQRLLRDHQLKVLQAQSASNQKVSVAVTTGATMGMATVAGVTAVQVSQAQQQRAQVTVFPHCLTTGFCIKSICHMMSVHYTLCRQSCGKHVCISHHHMNTRSM